MIDTKNLKLLGANNYQGLLLLSFEASPSLVVLFKREKGDDEALTLTQEARDAVKREFSYLTSSKQHSLASRMGLLNHLPMQCVKQDVVISLFNTFIDDDNTTYHKIRLDELLPETFKFLNTKHEN